MYKPTRPIILFLIATFISPNVFASRASAKEATRLGKLASAAPKHALAALRPLSSLAKGGDKNVHLCSVKALGKQASTAQEHKPLVLKMPNPLTQAKEEKEKTAPVAQGLIGGYGSYDAETGALNLSGYHRYKIIIVEDGVADRVQGSKPFAVRDVLRALREYKEQVRTIDLSYNMVGIKGATEIMTFAIKNLPKLQELNLFSNHIYPVDYLTDDFIEAARGLLEKDGFNTLNLRGNDITYTSCINRLFRSKEAKEKLVGSPKESHYDEE